MSTEYTRLAFTVRDEYLRQAIEYLNELMQKDNCRADIKVFIDRAEEMMKNNQ